MKKQILSLAVSAIIADVAIAGHDDQNLVIEINRGLPQLETAIRETTTGVKASPVSDGGELLQSLTGVSAIRMGGRALDPVIRGQKETQLNILLDGGYIHGGCPNRMDPPTAYTSVDSYDRVTVIKGNRTVVYGGGGSGGTVLFERDWPMIDEKGYNVDLAGSYRGNFEQWELGADLVAGNDDGYIRFIAHEGESENYDDGNGNEVESKYDSQSNAILGGIRLGDNTTLQASFEKADEEDVLFPGAQMDSPYADAENSRIKLEHQFTKGALRQLKIEAYQSDVIHLMDNAKMTSPSSSDTDGLRIVVDANAAEIDWTFGADLQKNDRDAVAYMVSNGMSAFSQWPGVEIDQSGLFVEGEKSVGKDDVVKAGLRYDRIKASASRAGETFGMMMGAHTPLSQYTSYYGVTDTDSTENNVGGFASWTHRFNDQYTVETTLSRSVRTADATERYIAKNPMMGTDWIGNPQIDPEKHHQIEAVFASSGDNLNWSVTGWYNRVNDYILRYNTGSADLYKNVDAQLYGIEAEANYQLSDSLSLATALAWLKGKNKDDGTHLSRISPLELNTSLDYSKQQWKLGAEWKLVAEQNDVCLSSDACGGQDVRQTPGYGIVNLHGEYASKSGVVVAMGVDNLFDKAYTLHESRDYVLDSGPVQVTEPGQNIWVRLSAKF
ncbi:TonB-dependent copper receptor [Neptuniibacter sp.]|uniref:TonB-dependent copper receptor n=1 Tax=Neptuniibacter sp. TaxID=1962643 RepID=UPI00262B2318|nr:TonB-dependent copper receptor [Neptuniibacter sp.]MCP4595591.1 TonB-dependent copper receptor [Neptuniibacter sp.]